MLRSLSTAAAGSALAVAAVARACAGEATSATSISVESRQPSFSPTLTPQPSGTKQRLFAVSPVNSKVVWASGRGGTYLLTTDGGQHWRARVVPGAESLEFRDVEGVSAKVAYLLSAGAGANNRIYKTEDGGATWKLEFQAGPEPHNFYDCFDFWTPIRGITFADGVDGRFPVIKNNGETWRDIGDQLPPAQLREAGFAASGTCITTQGTTRAWIGTGGGAKARVLSTTDGGNSWSSHDVPITQGKPTAGVVSLAFRDHFHGILGGGDVLDNLTAQNNVARSSDGGVTWELATPTPFTGAVYGLSYVPGHARLTAVATGPSGAAWSSDEGDTWSLLPGVTDFWAVAFGSRKAGWLVGGSGTILKIDFSRDGGDQGEED